MPKTKKRRSTAYYNRSIAFSDESGRLRRVCSTKNHKINRRAAATKNNGSKVVTKPKTACLEKLNVNLADQVTLTKNNRKVPPKPKSLTLEDLPDCVLLDIFSHVNIWGHNRLRFCTQRLCDVHVEYLFSRFRQIKNKGIEGDRIIMNAIYEATLPFMNFDPYRKILAGFLLELFRDHYNKPFDSRVIKNFCFQYFKFCENYNRTKKLHSPYMMFLCSSLRLLKELTSKPMERTFVGKKMSIVAHISDQSLTSYQKQPKNKDGLVEYIYRFLAILVELKISSENPNCMAKNDLDFISFHLVVDPRRSTTIHLNFKYNVELRDLCCKCCEDDEIEWPSVWPQLEFIPEIKLVGSRKN